MAVKTTLYALRQMVEREGFADVIEGLALIADAKYEAAPDRSNEAIDMETLALQLREISDSL